MGLDDGRLLASLDATLGLVQALDERGVLFLDAAVGEATTSASMDEVNQLSVGQLKQMLKVNAAVGELAESALLVAALSGGFLNLTSRQ
jgi:hypothetical protein